MFDSLDQICPDQVLLPTVRIARLILDRFAPYATYETVEVIIREVLDDPTAVIRDGSVHDFGGLLDPEIRDFAAMVAAQRESEAPR